MIKKRDVIGAATHVCETLATLRVFDDQTPNLLHSALSQFYGILRMNVSEKDSPFSCIGSGSVNFQKCWSVLSEKASKWLEGCSGEDASTLDWVIKELQSSAKEFFVVEATAVMTIVETSIWGNTKNWQVHAAALTELDLVVPELALYLDQIANALEAAKSSATQISISEE